MSAFGFDCCSRRMNCRLLASPSMVTVHVLTTHRSAGSCSSASRQPLSSKASLTCCVSYWFTLQPSVTRRQVFMVCSPLLHPIHDDAFLPPHDVLRPDVLQGNSIGKSAAGRLAEEYRSAALFRELLDALAQVDRCTDGG